jgi:class 3 adenylate cyclase/pimeloyl-ACP methyl ester carboxylesterase
VSTFKVPQVRYARSGGLHIAFQVLGDGPMDLVHVPPFISNLELQWEDAAYARYMRRLASFSRLIMFDKRGTGLSDRVDVASREERMDDVRAVMDAAGSERAVVFGNSEGGALAILFAVTYPERASALVLYGAYPRMSAAPDYPDGLQISEEDLRNFEEQWGRPGGGLAMSYLNPGQAEDVAYQEAMARSDRMSASPGAATAIMRMIISLDVRDLLPAIRVPTLVVYRTSDVAHAAGSRYLGVHIPGAKVVELPGDIYFPYLGDQDAVVSEIEEFLTGVRPTPRYDRVLATVLFTDIVGSTQTAARVGDQRWRDLLEHHQSISEREINRWRGRLIKSTGDGVLATFDGPARAVRCAGEIRDNLQTSEISIRAGVHTGEIELLGDDIGGIAVHIGQRISALADPNEILVSRTVVDITAGSGLDFAPRGEHQLKGVPGTWPTFAAHATI